MSAEHLESEEITPGSDRAFGYVLGVAFAAIAAYRWYMDLSGSVWVAGISILFLLFATLAPRLLHPLNIAWTTLGIWLGKVITPLVMFIVYVLTIIPIGLGMRMLGKNFLGLKRADDAESYWIDRDPPGPTPESLKDQF